MSKRDLKKLTWFYSTTITKLFKSSSVMPDVVNRIATALKVSIYDVVEVIQEFTSSNPIRLMVKG